VRLDLAVLAELAVRFTPKDYVRVTRLANAATPLGLGYGATRFASPEKTFKVLYLAWDLTTAVAEAVVRDRFQAKAHRRLAEAEVDLWGVSSVTATRPLTLIDLRATGLVRLGVSTEAARGKAQAQGRKLSQAVHDRTDADGLLYASRLTGAACVCIYERSVSVLAATPVTALRDQPDLVAALQALNVALRPTP
jgi:hypothetical protein